MKWFWPYRLAQYRLAQYRLATVSGDSMAPTYKSGDQVIVKIFSESSRDISINDVVLIERDVMPGIFFIKRITNKEGDSYWVEGDNTDPEVLTRMNDSRVWGVIKRAEIKGRLLFQRKRKVIS
jgi:phage repressor protein C with HTH and peptisase S24 domain